MPIKSSGPLSISEIAAEFGGSTPHSLSEYYRNGSLAITNSTNIPTNGAVRFGNFFGGIKYLSIAANSSSFYTGSYTIQDWGTNRQRVVLLSSGTLNIPVGRTALQHIVINGSGGGGGQGGWGGGGTGGGGGVWYKSSLSVNSGSHSITIAPYVVSGGYDTPGPNGSASVAFGYTAGGGGGGGGHNRQAGGSGGATSSGGDISYNGGNGSDNYSYTTGAGAGRGVGDPTGVYIAEYNYTFGKGGSRSSRANGDEYGEGGSQDECGACGAAGDGFQGVVMFIL
jgi:hypothetical protein